jgi:hypothetical protein
MHFILTKLCCLSFDLWSLTACYVHVQVCVVFALAYLSAYRVQVSSTKSVNTVSIGLLVSFWSQFLTLVHSLHHNISTDSGREMPRAVVCQYFTAEWWVQTLLRPYGICGGNDSVLEQVYIRVPLLSPVTIIPPLLHVHSVVYLRLYSTSVTETVVKQHILHLTSHWNNNSPNSCTASTKVLH